MNWVKEIKTGIINDNAWLNKTFLAPYKGYAVKVFYYGDNLINIEVDNSFMIENVEGEFVSEYNGWRYRIEKLIDFN